MENKIKQKRGIEEPWRRKEPGARLSKKTKLNQEKNIRERSLMEKRSVQNVKIIFTKKWTFSGFTTPKLFKGFGVKISVPMSRKEIMEKMRKAFPELGDS